MKVGTKSVLYGVHAFWHHPFILAAAWTRLYGFPWDPRLWLVFFIHDLGYVGCPNMDGEEGERHPERAARWLQKLGFSPEWQNLVLYHSRFYARRDNASPSKLCYADKLAIAMTPWWLYLPLARLTGELEEYIHPDHHENGGKYEGEGYLYDADPKTWYLDLQETMRRWVAHELGQTDRSPWERTPQ